MWIPRFTEVKLTKVSLLIMARFDIPIFLDSKHIFKYGISDPLHTMKTFCIYLTKIKYYKQFKVSIYPSPPWRSTFCPISGLYYFSEISLCWYMYVFLGNKYYYFHVFRFWHKWYHECTYSSTAWFLYFTFFKMWYFFSMSKPQFMYSFSCW